MAPRRKSRVKPKQKPGASRRAASSTRRDNFSTSEKSARRYLGVRLFDFLRSKYKPAEVRVIVRNLRAHVDDLKTRARARRREYQQDREQKGRTFAPPALTAVPVRRGKAERWVLFRGRYAVDKGRTYTSKEAFGRIRADRSNRFVNRVSQALGIGKRESRALISGAKKQAEKIVRAEKSRLKAVLKNPRASAEKKGIARRKLRRLSLARARRRVNGMLESAIHEIVSPGPRPVGSGEMGEGL